MMKEFVPRAEGAAPRESESKLHPFFFFQPEPETRKAGHRRSSGYTHTRVYIVSTSRRVASHFCLYPVPSVSHMCIYRCLSSEKAQFSPGSGNSRRIMSTVARTTVHYGDPRASVRAIKNAFCIMQDNQTGRTGLGQVRACARCRRGMTRGFPLDAIAAARRGVSLFSSTRRESTCKLIIY